jgi:hypothetical protein
VVVSDSTDPATGGAMISLPKLGAAISGLSEKSPNPFTSTVSHLGPRH